MLKTIIYYVSDLSLLVSENRGNKNSQYQIGMIVLIAIATLPYIF